MIILYRLSLNQQVDQFLSNNYPHIKICSCYMQDIKGLTIQVLSPSILYKNTLFIGLIGKEGIFWNHIFYNVPIKD